MSIGLSQPPRMPIVRAYDVLISAGHEGRPESCARFPRRPCNLGARGERAWTPVVADTAAAALRKEGFKVARLPADFYGTYVVDAAVFVHFDGSAPACASAASVGYPRRAFAAAAASWKRDYGRIFPFGFRRDNFTRGLLYYYGFRQVRARLGAFVLELGEITCPAQRAWLSTRLRLIGNAIAAWVSALIRAPRVNGVP